MSLDFGIDTDQNCWNSCPEAGGLLLLCQLVSALPFDGTQVCRVGQHAGGLAHRI